MVGGGFYYEECSNIRSNTPGPGLAVWSGRPAGLRWTRPRLARWASRSLVGSISRTKGRAMRRVGEPVVPLSTGSSRPPLAFRWQGRRYVVGNVLAHWVETGAWWRNSTSTMADPERHLWRVEVCRGRSTGVFDLCEDDAGWSLRGVHD